MAATLEPIGGILPAVLREVVARHPMSPGKLAFAWRAAVGGAIARATRVRRRGDGVVLVQVMSQPWRRELAARRPIIEERMRAWLGDEFTSLIILSEHDTLDEGADASSRRPPVRRR